jgi:hypothetical protein
MSADAKALADYYHVSYKSWLKHTAKVTSMHNAVSFIKHQVTDWKTRWGIIKTDQIAQELHDHLMK